MAPYDWGLCLVGLISRGAILFQCGLALLLVGMFLLLQGRTGIRRGTEPHCPHCDYCLTGIPTDRCPECGTVLIAEGIIRGEACHRPRLMVCGGILAALSVLLMVSALLQGTKAAAPAAARRVTVREQIRSARRIVAYRRDRVRQGTLYAAREKLGRPDPSRNIYAIHHVLLKVCDAVNSTVADPAAKTAAQAELQPALTIFEQQFLPAWQAAAGTQHPPEIQALAPLLDTIDTHLERAYGIMKGY